MASKKANKGKRMVLIQKVVAIQKDNRLSDYEMAKILGVSRPLWQKYRTKPDIFSPSKLLRGILRNYPELEPDLVRFIRGNGKEK